jgi:AcrR family transcriptional regulator
MPAVRARKSSRPRAGLSDTRPRPARDKDGRAERREAILDAALAEFSARGFAAARLDDIAGRAGVAKGTLYLYFRDKKTLFKELVRSRLSPLVDAIRTAAARDLSVQALVEMIVHVFVTEIFGTSRKDIIALIISEGQRFPELAEFYYREMIARVLPVVRRRLQQAVRKGELRHDALARFPQLLIAPALVAVLWSTLFDRFSPLDAKELMRAHLDVLFPERSGT